MAIERPLDALNQAKGKRVYVEVKNGRSYRGILRAFDIHINIVLEDAEELEDGNVKRKMGTLFLRGDTIVLITASE